MVRAAGEEPRERGDRRLARPLRRDHRRHRGRRHDARAAQGARPRGVPRTRRPTTSRSPRGSAASSRPTSRPRSRRSRRGSAAPGRRTPTCATARTRTSRRRSTRRTGGRPGIAQAMQLHGKEMSYNNYVDADAAVRAAFDFDEPAVAIIKHANPCGIAIASPGASDPIADAHRARARVRPRVGVRRRDRGEPHGHARDGRDRRPASSPRCSSRRRSRARRSSCCTKKKNLRLLTLPEGFAPTAVELRQVSGGLLLQQADRHFAAASEWTLAAGEPADAATLADLEFAWRACRAVKSNAILLASGGASVGVGMGQVNRVDSCRLAVERAGERAAGLGRGIRRLLPVRRRPADPDRRRRARGRAARRLRSRRGGRRGGPRGGRHDVLHRRAALLPLSPRTGTRHVARGGTLEVSGAQKAPTPFRPRSG